MPHMMPEIEQMTMLQVETTHGTENIPAELVSDSATVEDCRDYLEGKPMESAELTRVEGWFARLSAPGYMDCTDWSGPFETEDEAREYIRDTFDVNPDTGEDITD